MRKSSLSSGFLKLGCYCSRILIHVLSFSNTRLQQQTMAGITQCSKKLIRILSFSLIQDFSSRLWSGLHNVVRYSFEFFLFVIQDFSSRLWLGLLMAIYPTNFFALTRCMSTSWLSKTMFTLYRIVKRSVTETERYSVNRPRVLRCAAK